MTKRQPYEFQSLKPQHQSSHPISLRRRHSCIVNTEASSSTCLSPGKPRALRELHKDSSGAPIAKFLNSYNRYLAVAARVVRRSLKEEQRLKAERRGEMELKFAKWEVGLPLIKKRIRCTGPVAD